MNPTVESTSRPITAKAPFCFALFSFAPVSLSEPGCFPVIQGPHSAQTALGLSASKRQRRIGHLTSRRNSPLFLPIDRQRDRPLGLFRPKPEDADLWTSSNSQAFECRRQRIPIKDGIHFLNNISRHLQELPLVADWDQHPSSSIIHSHLQGFG